MNQLIQFHLILLTFRSSTEMAKVIHTTYGFVFKQKIWLKKTELHIPFKVNKVDSTDPTAIVSVNTTQRNGVNEVIGVASGFVTHVANSIVRANLRSDSTHAVVQVRVVASGNDNVKAVGTAPTGNVIQASATGPVMIGGVSTHN